MSRSEDDREAMAHRLLREALSLAEPERAPYVIGECAADTALLERVQRLLSAVGQSDRFLETPAWTAPRGAPQEPGQRIADFTILNRAGSGGMGEVYRAEQASPKRIVALKLIRSDRPSPSALARFALEAEALGRLQHPHVAHIIAAGSHATEGGAAIPYVAMEWIEGAQPIIQYALAARLPLRARLDLFLNIAAAVSHAHGRGVIHRDLKPGNVVVGSDHVVKVIDFGVALLSGDSPRTTLDGQFVGSLTSMSPEQCQRGSVDVRTDVYALGAMLFELVQGSPPFVVDGLPLGAAIEQLVTKPAPLARAGGEDLATVIATALAKSPDDRYASVEAFSRDVANVLAHRPIEARPPSFGRRARLFVRRHRAGVVTATIALLAMVVAGWGIGIGYMQARRAEAETARHNAELERVSEFLRSLITNTEYDRGTATRSIASELDNWIQRVEVEFSDMPAARGMLRRELGNNLMAVGRFDEARVALEGSLADYTAVEGEDAPNCIATRGAIARLLRDAGKTDDALSAYAILLPDVDRVFGASPINGDVIRGDYAMLLHSVRRSDEAAELLEAILARRIEVLGHENIRTAATLGQLGRVRFGQGRNEDAERLYREAIAIEERVADGGPMAAATTKNNLATVLRRLGREAEAITLYRDLFDFRSREQGPDDPETLTVQTNLGASTLALGEVRSGCDLLTDSYARHRRVLGPAMRGTVITGLLLARALVTAEAWGEAEATTTTLRADLVAAQPQFGTSAWRVAWCDCLRGRALIGLGRIDEGQAALDAGIAALEAGKGEPEATRNLALAREWRVNLVPTP
jgi:tetratricopeptide (TPR) repeat protein